MEYYKGAHGTFTPGGVCLVWRLLKKHSKNKKSLQTNRNA